MTPRPPLYPRQLAAFALAGIVLHVVVNLVTRFGFQRDEFLYLAMGRHLQLWRMDFPPGIALLANGVRALLGDSMTAIRMVPALAGAGVMVVAVLIARELGGARFAQGLTALAILTSPLFLRTALLFQPVVLDQVTWTLALYCLVRLGDANEPRWWLLLGTSLGLGLLVKFSALIFGAAVLLALLATPHRKALLTRWPWVAALVAFAIGSPSIVGQVALGFPVVTQMGQLRAGQLEYVTHLAFFAGQLEWGPAALLGLAGCAALVLAPRFARQRLAGWACLFAELILMLARGKSYYAGPLFPTLIAAGAVVLESSTAPPLGPPWSASLRWSVVAVTAVFGLLGLPIALPILTPGGTASYIGAMHLDFTRRNNQGGLEVLPQDFADMMGWEAQAEAMARAYRELTPEQRPQAVIGASNYGRAGALDYYGPRLGLPPVVSSAGSYWFFGPGPLPGNVALIIEDDDQALKRFWEEVRPVAQIHSEWSVGEERDTSIWLCLRPRTTLQEMWPSLRE
jgi:4-amino-4-deoxy-L-arabinose transferase-like glycosyltransferase